MFVTAMRAIADDGMPEMGEMFADLMEPPGLRCALDDGISGAVIAP